MKKLIFAVAIIAIAAACDPTPKKCSDLTELQEAVLHNSTDTAKYDLNYDGEVNVADVDYLINQQTVASDSTATDSVK